MRQYEFVVIGSGIAGLSVSLKLARHGHVAVITKRRSADSNTAWAQGGVACVTSAEDSFDLHIKDTLAAGGGLSNERAVRTIITGGPATVRELMRIGVHFDERLLEDGQEELDLGKEGGHSKRRVLHYHDTTGREIEQRLLDAVLAEPRIEMLQNHMAVDLITTGKLGYTTEDGVAMAWRAGAAVANMEFFQFHPTCLFHPQKKSFLITEAIRGEGGKLVDNLGREFMQKYHKLGALAPRDIVARAIDAEMKRTGAKCMFINITHKPP